MENIVRSIRKSRALALICGANFFLSLHYFLVIYTNSSLLEGFFPGYIVGLLFIAGAILAIILFILSPKIIYSFGIHRFMRFMLVLEFFAVILLAFTKNPTLLAASFIIHQAAIMMIYYSLDVLFETVTQKESTTGELRGIFLTLGNVTLIISPTLVGILASTLDFSYVYIVSSLVLIPTIILAFTYLGKIRVDPQNHTGIVGAILDSYRDKDLRYAISAQTVLQFFYAWMVIYLPLYLIQVVGFEWSEIGILFTIMLLPFILFEIPIGWLADKKYGEKELMISGFIIACVATGILSANLAPILVIWAIILFMTRVGASMVEITTESYFFKHTGSKDSAIVSVFRMTRPLSFILAPLIATITMPILGLGLGFSLLAFVTLFGAIFAMRIKDTR